MDVQRELSSDELEELTEEERQMLLRAMAHGGTTRITDVSTEDSGADTRVVPVSDGMEEELRRFPLLQRFSARGSSSGASPWVSVLEDPPVQYATMHAPVDVPVTVPALNFRDSPAARSSVACCIGASSCIGAGTAISAAKLCVSPISFWVPYFCGASCELITLLSTFVGVARSGAWEEERRDREELATAAGGAGDGNGVQRLTRRFVNRRTLSPRERRGHDMPPPLSERQGRTVLARLLDQRESEGTRNNANQ